MRLTFTYYILLPLFCISVICSCGNEEKPQAPAVAKTDMVTYPEKGAMRLLTDRPPQLETPLEIFKQDITPNDYFFVRWHMSQLVTRIDIDTFRLRVGGTVLQRLQLSMEDLRTKFAPDSIIALAICAGNSRSTFKPNVAGSQWKNGAMGNAKWKGVRLKDILAMAGTGKGAVDVSFHGMDRGAMPGIPAFVKSLHIAQAMDENVLVAYEMNGQPLPMLNGYPLKLVVPGWYASYWVGALGEINVHTEPFKGFWMDKAYKVANNAALDENPDKLATETVPVTTIKLHSIFVVPDSGARLTVGRPFEMQGLAYNDGTEIKTVEISVDGGASWSAATLNPEISKYSWRRWKYTWTPDKPGTYDLCVRATDIGGHTQPEHQWNRSGYARGFIEHKTVIVYR